MRSFDENIYVIAGNYEEYKVFCYYLSLNMESGGIEHCFRSRRIKYVDSINDLRGLRDVFGYKVGTWRRRYDWQELEVNLAMIESYDNFIEISSDSDFYDIRGE